MFFCLFFTSYKVEVTWLDEIAEGLKNVTTSLNNAILSIKGIVINNDPSVTLEDNDCVQYLQKVLRQICYTIGWVAGRLIQRDASGEDETLSKLNVL